jgi:hypothetical protein
MPRKTRRYILPNTREVYAASKLKKLTDDQQVDIMEGWFSDRYAPPYELPYDSAEGGYQWIWGSPVEPRDEISLEFEGSVFEAALKAVIDKLEDQSFEWTPHPDFDDFDADYEAGLLESGHPYYVLIASLSEIETTAKHRRPKADAKIIHRLLFANIITSLEAYLGDRFRRALFNNRDFIKDFVLKSGHFREQKIPLSDVFKRAETLDTEVRTFVSAHNWHSLTISIEMYKQAFGVALPQPSQAIRDGIRQRHDIVHRNGKTLDGTEGSWGLSEIRVLKEEVLVFVTEIEELVKHLPVSGVDEDHEVGVEHSPF